MSKWEIQFTAMEMANVHLIYTLKRQRVINSPYESIGPSALALLLCAKRQVSKKTVIRMKLSSFGRHIYLSKMSLKIEEESDLLCVL